MIGARFLAFAALRCNGRSMTDRTYRLLVEGELSDDLAVTFPGMVLTRAAGTTTLTGTMRDQAELQGLLQRVSELGLTLLEAKAIDGGPDRRLRPARTDDSPAARAPDERRSRLMATTTERAARRDHGAR